MKKLSVCRKLFLKLLNVAGRYFEKKLKGQRSEPPLLVSPSAAFPCPPALPKIGKSPMLVEISSNVRTT